MPKSARCPHCDRSYDRRVLDAHILKCRSRRDALNDIPAPSHQVVIVDGNNVAYFLAPDGQPRAENLVRAIRSLSSSGYKPFVVISAALKHKIDKPMILQNLVTEGYVIEAPRGIDDDLTIIEEAMKRAADIVSNDRFLNWLSRYPWVPARLRRYRMTQSGLILT